MVGIKFCDRQYVGKIKILQLDFQKRTVLTHGLLNALSHCHSSWPLIKMSFSGGVMAVVFFPPQSSTHFSQKESSKPLKILMILQIHSIFV